MHEIQMREGKNIYFFENYVKIYWLTNKEKSKKKIYIYNELK